MFIVFIGGVVLSDSPFTSVQMLWVNLIMDTFAALALATEPPQISLLDDKPYSRNDRIVTAVMWRNILGHAAFQIIILVLMLFVPSIFGISYDDTTQTTDDIEVWHYTQVFNTFVFMQIFNEINARKLGAHEYNVFEGFFNNWLFLGILIFTSGM